MRTIALYRDGMPLNRSVSLIDDKEVSNGLGDYYAEIFIQLSESVKSVNLCETCDNEFATCESNPFFGCGFGNDNVYRCNSYSN